MKSSTTTLAVTLALSISVAGMPFHGSSGHLNFRAGIRRSFPSTKDVPSLVIHGLNRRTISLLDRAGRQPSYADLSKRDGEQQDQEDAGDDADDCLDESEDEDNDTSHTADVPGKNSSSSGVPAQNASSTGTLPSDKSAEYQAPGDRLNPVAGVPVKHSEPVVPIYNSTQQSETNRPKPEAPAASPPNQSGNYSTGSGEPLPENKPFSPPPVPVYDSTKQPEMPKPKPGAPVTSSPSQPPGNYSAGPHTDNPVPGYNSTKQPEMPKPKPEAPVTSPPSQPPGNYSAGPHADNPVPVYDSTKQPEMPKPKPEAPVTSSPSQPPGNYSAGPDADNEGKLPSSKPAPSAPVTEENSTKPEEMSQTKPGAPVANSSYPQPGKSGSYPGREETYTSGGGDIGKFSGKATFFTQDNTAGACGKKHQDTDYVVAIQSDMYRNGEFCGKTIAVTRGSTGQTIHCVAADECPGCPTAHSLDLSVAAFNALGKPEEGVFDISWKVVDES